MNKKRGIIVEGIDCGGKSTLIKNLKFCLKNFGGFDVKELEHKNVDNQYYRYLYEYSISSNILFDRSHISEIVYGSLLRNHIPFTDKEVDILNNVIYSDYILVLAVPSFKDFSNRIKESKKYQIISEGNYEKIINEFKEVTKDLNFMEYSSSSYKELDLMTDLLIKMLKL